MSDKPKQVHAYLLRLEAIARIVKNNPGALTPSERQFIARLCDPHRWSYYWKTDTLRERDNFDLDVLTESMSEPDRRADNGEVRMGLATGRHTPHD